MRGRGTRTAPHIQKQLFVIYDFFRNHQYFNDSDTDIFSGVGTGRASSGSSQGHLRPPVELIELGVEDEWLEALVYVEVGPEGERVDKHDYMTNWQQTVQAMAQDDKTLRKIRDNQPLTEAEEQELAERLNRPTMYFNEENLRRAYRRPGGVLIDFIKAALGTIKLKSQAEELVENFQAWLVAKNLNPEQANYLTILKNRGIVQGKIEVMDLFKPPLSMLNAAQVGIELFGEQGLRETIEDLNISVFNRRAA
jgi:type I restriction enzyme R subunit